MKKGIFAIGIPVVIAPILIAAALRDPTALADIAPLSHETPFATEIESAGYDTGFKMRTYSLHMSFDDAVKFFETQLASKGWTHMDSYGECRFHSKPHGGDDLWIARGRLLTDVKNEDGKNYKVKGSLAKFEHLSSHDLSDCRDWVTVQSVRRFGQLDSALLSLRRSMREPARRMVLFEIVAPAQKPGTSGIPIDVHVGTSRLESTTDISITYSAASVDAAAPK